MNATSLTYLNMTNELAAAIPELRPALAAELTLLKDSQPPNVAIVGTVLGPFVIETLRRGDDANVARIFEFVERMSTSQDELVRIAADTEVIEHLLGWGRRADLHRAERAMGPSTRTSYEWHVARGLFRAPKK